jgi:ABC-2 type transport system permease protein
VATAFRQYLILTKFQFMTQRTDIWFISLVNVAFIAGFVWGYGYLYGEMPERTALYLTTGAAANALVFIALVMLPQVIVESKVDGRLDFLRTLPISREAYLLSMATYVGIVAIPSMALALLVGAWRYDLSLEFDPMFAAVIPLAMFSMAGFGIAMGILLRKVQVVNALTQLVIFYVVFFAPIMIPKDFLPEVFQIASAFFPPTYVADAVRGSTTNLADPNLTRSMLVMFGFGAVSLVAASTAIRRRG